MANFEEENAQLRAELATMKEDLAEAHDTMSTLMAAQEQPVTSGPVLTEVVPSIPLSTVTSDARFVMPNGRPYGLSAFYAPNTAAGISGIGNQGQVPVTTFASTSTSMPQVTTVTDPVVHIVRQVIDVDTTCGQDPIMEAMREQLRELAGELRRSKLAVGTVFLLRPVIYAWYPDLKFLRSSKSQILTNTMELLVHIAMSFGMSERLLTTQIMMH
jgi:hypothetical protein